MRDLVDHRADELFAFAQRGGGGIEDRPDVGAGGGDPGQFLFGQRDRAAGALGGQVVLGGAHRRELCLQGSSPKSLPPNGSPARRCRTGGAHGRLHSGRVRWPTRTPPGRADGWRRPRPTPGRWRSAPPAPRRRTTHRGPCSPAGCHRCSGRRARRHRAVWRGHTHTAGSCPWCPNSRSA